MTLLGINLCASVALDGDSTTKDIFAAILALIPVFLLCEMVTAQLETSVPLLGINPNGSVALDGDSTTRDSTTRYICAAIRH